MLSWTPKAPSRLLMVIKSNTDTTHVKNHGDGHDRRLSKTGFWHRGTRGLVTL